MDDNTTAIVRAAIDLSHALGLDAVAEGVENQAALDRLRDMGCDAAQGYFFARPMPGANVISWLAEFQQHPWIRRVQGLTLPPRAVSALGASKGTVLVVDDAHPFRVAAHRILSAQGYRVVHAATASEAMRICAELNGNISLLLTDIHLSDWRGDDLAERLQGQYPAIRTMFMSGDPNGRLASGTGVFLAKPFSNRELVDQVAQALAS